MPQAVDDTFSFLVRVNGFWQIEIADLLANDKGGKSKSFSGLEGLVQGTDWYVQDGYLYVGQQYDSFQYIAGDGSKGTVTLPLLPPGQGSGFFDGGFEFPDITGMTYLPNYGQTGYLGTYESWTNLGDAGGLMKMVPKGLTSLVPTEGNYLVELDATSALDTITSTNLDLAAGQTYTLSFDYLSRRDITPPFNSTDSFEVWWNGSKIATIDPNGRSWDTYTAQVVGREGADVLEFREVSATNTGDRVGVALDHILLV